MFWQQVFDLRLAVTSDERHMSLLDMRIHRVQKRDKFFWLHARSHFNSNWVADVSRKFDVRPVGLARPIAKPHRVRAEIIAALGSIARQCVFEFEDETFV